MHIDLETSEHLRKHEEYLMSQVHNQQICPTFFDHVGTCFDDTICIDLQLRELKDEESLHDVTVSFG